MPDVIYDDDGADAEEVEYAYVDMKIQHSQLPETKPQGRRSNKNANYEDAEDFSR